MQIEKTDDRRDADKRVRTFPRLKAAIGCYCIHCGLTTLVVLSSFIFGVEGNAVAGIYLWYFLIGWIPVAIWIYPILKRKMRWI